MSLADDPPAKKRRFDASSPGPAYSSPNVRFFQDADEVHAHSSPSVPSSLAQSPSVQAFDSIRPSPSPKLADASSLGFDQATFESFVGDKVAPDVLKIIRENSGDSIERAINMYFDGSWKRFKKTSPPPQLAAVSRLERLAAFRNPPRPNPESRYVGAFGASGWATRSGTQLLSYGDTVKIERQKLQQVKKGARGSAAAAKRVDVIVRILNNHDVEVGRLSKESADWVSPLMDQKICNFEGSVVFAPERLRSGDTFYIRVTCSLLRTAFDKKERQLDDNRKISLFDQDENAEERSLRLRQVALVRLFQEISLEPSKRNAAADKDQRKRLLEAADLAEKRELESSKTKAKEKPGSSPPSADENNEDGEELEQDQLDALYKKAQSFDFSTPEQEPSDTFALTLRPYQKQALHWMISKEKNQQKRDGSMHPLWEEYTWPLKDHADRDIPEDVDEPCFYLNPYSGDMSLDFPKQEQHCLGGILADEMGLGKTIQMLSLVHSHRSEVAMGARGTGAKLPRVAANRDSVVDAPCTTLVVAPMSLLAQWQSEAEKASKEGTMRSIVYYGAEKMADLRAECCESNAADAPDVVITSYGVVLSEFSQLGRNRDGPIGRGLFSLNFFRVILDEAHTIKNRQAKTARACYDLAAEHRWVLTGTPIVNKLEDLFSLVRFLRVEPWSNFSFWRTFITVPFESKNFVRALDVVQTVLEPLVMRRTKDMKTPDGNPLVPLPPKHVEFVEIELSEPERAVYNHILTRAKQTLSNNVEAGTVFKAYTSILAQIMRLRQSCCHPILVRKQDVVAEEEELGAAADRATGLDDDMDLQALIERFTACTEENDGNAFGAHVLQQIRDEASSECPFCSEEPMRDQTVTGCWHSACKTCLLDYIKHQTDRHEVPKCISCREPINMRDVFEVVRHDEDERISLQRLGANNSSAKIVTLMAHLRELRRELPRAKTVVFSQFTSFLSLLEPALGRAGVRFLRLDGTTSQKARATVLAEFAESSVFTVLLLSLKAGGVGLNLTSATRVYMMDPWWSFAVEAQAIDRVHRMGQEEEVRVYRFIVKNTVEERMLRIQEKKKFIATSLGMMSDQEKKLARIEDIKHLLS